MKRGWIILAAAVALAVAVGGGAAQAADLGLVGLLTRDLGVTKTQASGGAGSMFNLAQRNMGTQDFAKLAAAVPGIDGMMASAPKPKTSNSGLLGGVSSLLGGGDSSSVLGGNAAKVGGAVELAESFSQLGMKAGLVQAFTPIVLNYVKAKGGEPLMLLLQAALQ